jgi:WD40 repeat protein
VAKLTALCSQAGHYRDEAAISRWFFKRAAIQIIAGISATVLPILAHSESSSNIFAKVFGSTMNDVAVKVAELPETYREVIVPAADFSPDGTHIAVESDAEKINIWDWRRHRIEKTIERPYGGNDGNVTNPIGYSPDGRFLAACEMSGARDVVVRIWSTADWSIAKDLTASPGTSSPGACTSTGFTPDGRLFGRTSDTGGRPGNNLVVYDASTWQPTWGLPMERFGPVSLAISPDGQMAAVGGILVTVPENARDPNASLDLIKHDPFIYVVNLQQRKIALVIPCIDRGPIAWSPDGL